MPKIPLYEHTPTATPSSNVRLDPNMYSGVAAAGERIGAAVSNIGNQMNNFAVKKQEAINYAGLQDAQRQMQEGSLLYQDDMATNPDHDTWSKGWENKVAEIEKNIQKTVTLSDDAKVTLGEMTKTWKVMTAAKIKNASTAAEIKQGAAKVVLAYDFLLANGNVEQAIATIEGGASVGYFDDKEKNKLISQAPGIADQKAALSLLVLSPITAEAALTEKTAGGKFKNFTELDEQDRLTLINKAQSGANEIKSANFQELIKLAIKGTPPVKDDILKMVEDGKITPSDANSYINSQLSGKFAPAGTFSMISAAIGSLNPSSPTFKSDSDKLLDQIATSGLQPALMTQAIKKWTEFSDPDSAINTVAGKRGSEIIESNFKNEVYGKWELVDKLKGTTTTDKKILAEARARQSADQDALRAYMNDHRNATNEEVTKFVQGLNHGPTVDKTISILNQNNSLFTPVVQNNQRLSSEIADLEKPVEKGNVDLFAQPEVQNPDGGKSTVFSRSFNIDGKEVLLPAVTPDGRFLDTEAKILDEYKKTGRHLGKFETVKAANKYAKALHNAYEAGVFTK
jgi:hypothetical protein